MPKWVWLIFFALCAFFAFKMATRPKAEPSAKAPAPQAQPRQTRTPKVPPGGRTSELPVGSPLDQGDVRLREKPAPEVSPPPVPSPDTSYTPPPTYNDEPAYTPEYDPPPPPPTSPFNVDSLPPPPDFVEPDDMDGPPPMDRPDFEPPPEDFEPPPNQPNFEPPPQDFEAGEYVEPPDKAPPLEDDY
ncbi:MAG: hypothetical protein KDD51_02700 [Bdellovibrionales bacterium]|nr:hypothetical protein [Bdellovibrionales bacterium]